MLLTVFDGSSSTESMVDGFLKFELQKETKNKRLQKIFLKREMQREKTAKVGMIERLGERVFVTSPRMLSFSHRSQISLRHPYLPYLLSQVESEHTKPTKRGAVVTRGELLVENLQDVDDDERWRAVARMIDSKMFEKDISQRRQHALENAALRRALETWWCKAGGTTSKGVSEESYRQIHNAMFREILNVHDLTLHAIVTKSVSQDWLVDSEGKGEVSFGRWYVSLLEIADNWVPNCEGENYGLFLQKLLAAVFGGATAPPSAKDGLPWNEVCENIRRNSRLYHNPKLITKRWNSLQTAEYCASNLQ